MEKVTYTIDIKAPREKVWKTMLEDATYREWTSAFNPGGSYYEGDWSEGSKILFLGPDPEHPEKKGGMVSKIAQNKPYEFVSIQHLGMINDGVEDTTSEEVKKWGQSFENYTFTEKGDFTNVRVDLDVPAEYKDMFSETWPKALEKLKELAEK